MEYFCTLHYLFYGHIHLSNSLSKEDKYHIASHTHGLDRDTYLINCCLRGGGGREEGMTRRHPGTKWRGEAVTLRKLDIY